MNRNLSQLDELQFLSEFRNPRQVLYRHAPWLKNGYDDMIWECQFGTATSFKIDFQVKLNDGTLLSENKHKSLLETLKSWICSSCQSDLCGGRTYAGATMAHQVTRTVKLIDYLLLNSEKFDISNFGLKSISEDDLTSLLAQLAITSETSTSIYSWPTRLAQYLRTVIASSDIRELEFLIETRAELSATFVPAQDRMLDLSDKEVILAKAWLFRLGYYGCNGEWRNTPSTAILASAIYAETLLGKVKKPVPPELILDVSYSIEREHAGVPVTADDDGQMSIREWSRYKGALENLLVLEELALPIPSESIRKICPKDFNHFLSRSIPGRFKTLPQDVVLYSLRSAADFIISRGDSIIDSVINVITYSRRSNTPCRAISTSKLADLICPKLTKLGTRTWSLGAKVSGRARTARRLHGNGAAREQAKNAYFVALRENQGLWELIRVLYGAVQTVVGILMARRQEELRKLTCSKALDKSGRYMIFANGKSGVGDIRQLEARPIPSLAADAIRMLMRFHTSMRNLGVSDGDPLLFSYPSADGTRICALLSPAYNESLDRFCDYAETPLTEDGLRYYLRQHQLRRSFAMAFFWGGSFGGLDTLRWFLGHTDVEHLYHYITESVPGAVLRSIKVDYATHAMESHTVESDAFSEFVRSTFGISTYTVLDSEEVEEYVGLLLDRGDVSVEPEFFELDGQKRYKIVIKICNLKLIEKKNDR